jgi:hypothetical protein
MPACEAQRVLAATCVSRRKEMSGAKKRQALRETQKELTQIAIDVSPVPLDLRQRRFS